MDRVPLPWCYKLRKELCTPPLVLQAEKRALYPPLGPKQRERGGFDLPTSGQRPKTGRLANSLRNPELSWFQAVYSPLGQTESRSACTPRLVPIREQSFVRLQAVYPPFGLQAESELATSCVLPPLAKRRADLHEPPPWFQSESRDWSGSKPCTPLLVSKQRVEAVYSPLGQTES